MPPQSPSPLSNSQSILWVLVGILISLVLPIALRTLVNAATAAKAIKTMQQPTLTDWLKAAWIRYGGTKYVGIMLAATLVAGVIVLLLGLKFYAAREAALAGFAWESLVNKLLANARIPTEGGGGSGSAGGSPGRTPGTT